MPEIPQFTPPQAVPLVTDTARADPNALAMPGEEGVRQGLQLQQAGGRLEQLGDALGKLQEFHNTQYYNDTLADLTSRAYERHESGKEEVRQTGNYKGFAQSQIGALDQDIQGAVENAPQGVASRLQRRLTTLRDTMLTRSTNFEHGMGQNAAIASITDDVNRTGVGVARAPDRFLDEYARIGAAIDNYKQQGLLNPEQYQKLRQHAGNSLAEAAVRARATDDPAGLAADWAAKRYDSFIDLPTMERLGPVVSNAKGDALGRQYSPVRNAGAGAVASTPQPNASDADADKALASVVQRESDGKPYVGYTPPGQKPVDLSKVPLDDTGFPIWAGNMGPKGISHAAGLFQIQPDTWRPIARQLGIHDFSEDSQRAVARELYRQQGLAPWAASAPGAAGPNLDKSVSNILAAPGYTDQERDRGIAVATREYHQWHQATAQERAGLESDLRDGIARLASGRDWTPDPVAIRGLLPAEKADEALRAIDEARDQGNARNMVQWASPEDLAQLAERTKQKLDGGQDFARQQRFADTLSKAIVARNKALDDDPAQFAGDAAPVAAARAAAKADPQNPDKMQAAIGASLAEQDRLGVSPENQRVLSKGEAADVARQVTASDPAKTDIGAALDGLARNYGQYWPRAFGDLVKAGLPAEAQLLGAMDTPDQAAARTDFQRMLATRSEKGGAAKLRESAPNAQDIDNGLNGVLEEFRATVRDPGLYDAVRDGIKHLAYFYAFQGKSADAALKAAYDGVIGRKYDFDGSIRAPKGSLPDVERAADAALSQLTAARVRDPGPDPSGDGAEMTVGQRQAVELSAIRRGYWETNKDDTGLIRMALRRDGSRLPAIVDGKPLTILFKAVAASPPPYPGFADMPPSATGMP